MQQLILAGLMAGMDKSWILEIGEYAIPANFRDTKSKRKRSRFQIRGW